MFLFIGFWPLFKNPSLNQFFIYLGFLFIFLTVLKPSVFNLPNLIWFKFGMFLGYIISPIIMLFIYLIAFVPTKIFFIVTKKDPMNIKYDKDNLTDFIDY